MRDRILFNAVFRPPPAEQGWQPLLDIYQLRDGWLLKADLAGVNPEDITVVLIGRRVILRGLRRDLCVEEGCNHYRMEISYSRFERIVELPVDLNEAEVSSEFRHGMLLIRIGNIPT